MRQFTLGVVLLLVGGLAWAVGPTAVVRYQAPTLNTDGTAITATLTYNIYQGPQGGTLVKVQTGLTGLSAVVSTGLVAGTTQCFAVTAVAGSQESSMSTSACAAVNASTPGNPTVVVVTIS